MRHIVIGILLFIAATIGWSAPAFVPLTPSNRVPTFGEALTNRAELESAAQKGPLPQDQSQRLLRQRVTDAARRVEAFPCDNAARQELRTALVIFMKERLRRFRSGKDEMITVNGREMDGTVVLNREVDEIFSQAMVQGLLRPSDLPPGPFLAAAQMSVLESGPGSQFICDPEGRR